jgi:hypothetical protein
VLVRVGVRLGVKLLVGVRVRLAVAVMLGVRLGVKVAEAVGVWVGVKVIVAVAVWLAVAVGVCDGVSVWAGPVRLQAHRAAIMITNGQPPHRDLCPVCANATATNPFACWQAYTFLLMMKVGANEPPPAVTLSKAIDDKRVRQPLTARP